MLDKNRKAICDYEGSDYQERFWDRGERLYEDRVEAAALKKLLPSESVRLLEVGAGAGRNVPRYNVSQKVVLVDYAYSQLKLARERLGKDERFLFIVADAYHLPFVEETFNTATMIRTIHHMIDPKEAIQQIRAVLKPGAVFILEFANKRNLKAILRWVIRRQTWNPFERGSIEFAPLNFNFHPKDVEMYLKAADFKIERKLTVSHFRLNLLKRWIPLNVLVGLDSLLQWTGILWQYTPSVFIKTVAIRKGNGY